MQLGIFLGLVIINLRKIQKATVTCAIYNANIIQDIVRTAYIMNYLVALSFHVQVNKIVRFYAVRHFHFVDFRRAQECTSSISRSGSLEANISRIDEQERMV